MGLPGEVNHPDVVAEVRRSFDTIRRHGAAPSTLARNVEDLELYAQAGATAIAYQGDVGLVYERATGVIQSVRDVTQSTA